MGVLIQQVQNGSAGRFQLVRARDLDQLPGFWETTQIRPLQHGPMTAHDLKRAGGQTSLSTMPDPPVLSDRPIPVPICHAIRLPKCAAYLGSTSAGVLVATKTHCAVLSDPPVLSELYARFV